MVDSETFDYIVVGAGSSGATVAARLSESGKHRVLLLEAGPADPGPWRKPWLHVPFGHGRALHDGRVTWSYWTEPVPGLDGRRLPWFGGKVLGGTSAINALVYVRGLTSDYDLWRSLGNVGWSFADLLPFFRKAERNERGADALHGGEGPQSVSDIPWRPPLAEAYIAACREAGVPANDDFNGPAQEGTGYYQLTSRRGRRASAARAYLHPARRRANLTVRTRTRVERILVEGGRAVGVAWRDGQARAAAEVVLCGGAVKSPQLLLLRHRSRRRAAALRHRGGARPARCRREPAGSPADPLALPRRSQGYAERRTGWPLGPRKALGGVGPAGARPAHQRAALVGAFLRSRPELPEPDLQLTMAPFSSDSFGRGFHASPGFTVVVCASRPQSRGRIRLSSPDPRAPPAIEPNYLAAAADIEVTLAGLRWVRRIAEQPALRPWIERELQPGEAFDSEETLQRFLRRGAHSGFHPVGSCRMGPGTDRSAVVDERLRVRGIAGLRVADASIMPTLVSGNTSAPCIMIGEKCAAMLLEDGRDSPR